MLKTRLEAGRFLEMGVLADIKGEPAEELLQQSLEKLKQSRAHMDELYSQIGVLQKIERENEALPEHKMALQRILKNHPPVERVSLTNSRFANVGGGKGIAVNYGPIGSNYTELLDALQTDLKIVQVEHDQVIEAFSAVMPLARKGGFAAMVLSGRAPLPERVMHSADQILVFTQFYNRACMTSIAADMQVYPKGLEWLPQVEWKQGAR